MPQTASHPPATSYSTLTPTAVSSDLHVLAQHLAVKADVIARLTGSRHGLTEIVEALRTLASRTVVVLPTIDGERDDVAHWRGLRDRKLRGENAADAWNLAAGLYVARERAEHAAAPATEVG